MKTTLSRRTPKKGYKQDSLEGWGQGQFDTSDPMAFEDKPGCKIIINYHLFSRQVVGKRQGSCTFSKEGMGGKERESCTLRP